MSYVNATPAAGALGVESVSYQPLQDGYYDVVGGTWNETGNLLLHLNSHVGLIFDIYQRDSQRNLPLEPPTVTQMSLSITPVPGQGTAINFGFLGLVPELEPALYSAALWPSNRGETSYTGFTVAAGDDSRQTITWTVAGLGAYFNTIFPGLWTGRVALTMIVPFMPPGSSFLWLPSEGTGGPTLDVVQFPFFTGWEGDKPEHGRPAHDMKTGLPAHAPDLVEDGYRPGIWTSPSQWDPADPRDEHPVSFPDNEGQWDDDVPAS